VPFRLTQINVIMPVIASGQSSFARHSKIGCRMSALGHSRPSHFVPVLNNVRYASDSDHSRYESELTLWAINGLMHCNTIGEVLGVPYFGVHVCRLQ
jgi:hypothetical protein